MSDQDAKLRSGVHDVNSDLQVAEVVTLRVDARKGSSWRAALQRLEAYGSNRFRPSLRVVLAVSMAAIGLLSTWTVAALVARHATARLEVDVGEQLDEVAQSMARNLDRGMFERWRDMQIAASLDTLRDAGRSEDAKRAVLERLHQTYPAYSIIGLLDPDGRIAVTSNRLLEGASAAKRDYFLAGRERPFVGDVHDALLLAKLLPSGTKEPLRLVDLSTPVRDRDGQLIGVLAAHLDWAWAREAAQVLAGSLKGRRQGAEILVLAQDDTVLLGPAALQGQKLPGAVFAGGRTLDPESGSRVTRWPDSDAEYVSALERTQGYRDYPGLGWRVVVRHQANLALSAASDLRGSILAVGSLVTLGAAAVAWLLAGYIARPLNQLATAASAIGRGERVSQWPSTWVREEQVVANALEQASVELRARHEVRRLLVDELNHRVKNTLATVQSLALQSFKGLGDGAAGSRETFESRLLALSRTHNILTQENWSSADLASVAAEAVRPFAGLDSERIMLSGPSIRLAPQPALAMAMILHELCTNAVKYGALSVPAGTVMLDWTMREASDGTPLACVTWSEHEGPPVQAPSRKGFGSRLIERGLAAHQHASVVLAYEAAGVRSVMTIPSEMGAQ